MSALVIGGGGVGWGGVRWAVLLFGDGPFLLYTVLCDLNCFLISMYCFSKPSHIITDFKRQKDEKGKRENSAAPWYRERSGAHCSQPCWHWPCVSPGLSPVSADMPMLPSSLMLLNTAHEYLGRRAWCCNSEGALLRFYVSAAGARPPFSGRCHPGSRVCARAFLLSFSLSPSLSPLLSWSKI